MTTPLQDFRYACLTALLALVSSLSLGQATPPSADTFVSSAFPKTNYGSSIILIIQPGVTSYLRFNLATLPTGASVNKATLLQRAFKDGQQAFRDDMRSTLPSANPYAAIDIDLVRAWNAGYATAHATKIQKTWQRVMVGLNRKAA